MAGAIIAIDQARPGPSTSYGAPGVARNDLWEGRVVSARSTQGGNGAFQWTLLAKPSGSAATLSGATTATATFTPDLPGSYRVQLVTNGGGTGNVQVLIAAVRYDTNGVLTNRGWRAPAFGEVPAEDNFLGQTQGWAEAMEYIFADLVATAGDASALAVARTVTANQSPYAVLATDVALAVDTTLGPVNLQLSPAVSRKLLAVWDAAGTAGTHAITITATIPETLAGAATHVISSSYGAVLLVGDAASTSWGVFGGGGGGGGGNTPTNGTGAAFYAAGVANPTARAVNLASAGFGGDVTGLLGSGNQADQTLGGALRGTTGAADFGVGSLGTLGKKLVSIWMPTGVSGTTLANAASGLGVMNSAPMLWSGVSSGLGRAVAATNKATRMKRVNMKAVSTAAGQFSGGRIPASDKIWTAGSGVAGDGSGFYAVHRWVEADPAPVAGRRSFIGFCAGGSSQDANVEPDTLLNRVGIGQLSGDSTQFYWIQAGSAAQAAVPIGVAFPPGGNSVNAYELVIWSLSAEANIFYLQLTHLISGAVASHVMTGAATALPQSTTFLNFNAWACNNATALEICLDWALLYVETDP